MLESPLSLESRYRFEHQERRELEERLNKFYGTKDDIEELRLDNSIWRTNISGFKYTFLPLRIYSFSYIYTNDGKQRSSIDIRPLVFVLSEYSVKGDIRVKGLNLNFLPRKAMIHFLEGYIKYFKPALNQDLVRLENGNATIYEFQDKDVETFIDMLKAQFPEALNSVRIWRKSQIPPSSVKVVKVSDYDKLFEYSAYKNTIKGKHWGQIQYSTITGE